MNQEEVQWTKKNWVDLPRLPSPHGYKASFGVGGGPLPPHLTHRKTAEEVNFYQMFFYFFVSESLRTV